jgi:tetratricopeptide (TPR) repeat protein
MVKSKRHLILCLLVLATFFNSCQSNSRQLEKAKALYEQGLELSSDNSVAAAESYSQALLELDRCDQELLDVKRLKGQIEDQLGTRYWKNGLKEEALELHKDAIEIFRQLPGNVYLMNALQNAGRVAASLNRIDEAEKYYDEALQLAQTQSSKKLSKDLQLELCRDVYMEKGEYEKVIKLVTEALEHGARPDLCHLTLGMAYYYIEDDKHAIDYLSLATESEKAGVRMPAYQGLYQIYELQKNYLKALQCFEKYNENMTQAHGEQRNEEMQRIKRDYDLQIQRNAMQAEQKLKSFYLYLVLGLLVVALVVTLLLLRQKTLKTKLKDEESQHQLDVAMKKNKVFLTALALSEKITGNTVDFNLDESEWNDYLELIDMIYSDFTKKLLERYPSLTKTDLQICSLTRQGFSNQVISIMMNLQTNSYARRKYRIKQEKMNGAEDDRSFEEIINEI